MAIIYTYPRLSGQPEGSDLILITDVSDDNKSKNTTIQSINDLGPQGTVTSVNLTMPSGFIVDKTRNNGDISFAVTGFPDELPADDPANSIQYNENGTLKGSPQLAANPLQSGTTIDSGVELSLGSISRTSGPQPPRRGRMIIGSGPISQSDVDTYGASIQLEYVYPTLGPVTGGLPGSRAAAYSFVTLKAPKYDYNIEIDPDGRNLSLGYQDYDLILPQINPTHSGSNQPYTDSQLLVVNPVDASSTGNLRDFETKFVPLSALGLSVGGVQNSIQFNDNNALQGNNFFTVELLTEPDHSPGGRLQLTIGSPALTPNEPYGSILLNGGNNNDEGGIIRLASAINNTVGIAGPQPSPSPVADYTYDFSLPIKSPEQTEQSFNQGAQTVDVDNGGSGYSQGAIAGTLNPQGTGSGCTVRIDSIAVGGGITAVSVHQPGEGYSVNDILTLNIGGNTTATVEVLAIEGYKNKVLVASEDRSFGPNGEKLYETRWVDPNDLGISGTGGGVSSFTNVNGTYISAGTENSTATGAVTVGTIDLSAVDGVDTTTRFLSKDNTWAVPGVTVEKDGQNQVTGVNTVNFTGAGVSVGNPSTGQVDVNVLPRLNHGFSPFPIYQGNDGITVTQGNVIAIACNTVCDIAAGQLTVVRVFGDIPENCNINVAVYSGELRDAANTQLLAFANGVNAGPASNQIIQLDLDDMLPNAGGTNPLWSPAAGTPIVVLIEIDNSNGDGDAHILGSTAASFPSSGITGIFGTSLAWEIETTQSIFVTSGANANIKYQDPITDVSGYADKEDTQLRVCHHFDPFAP